VAAGRDVAKLLVSGTPLVAGGAMRGDDPVLGVVHDPAHRFVAILAGDVHNYQRHPVRTPAGPTVQHIVCGGGGAYMNATHAIPRVALPGCDEADVRLYPLRGDSLAWTSRRFEAWAATTRRRDGSRPRAAVGARRRRGRPARADRLGLEPVRASARAAVPADADRAAAARVFPPGGLRGWNRFGDQYYDSDEPPFFKHLLRLDVTAAELRIRCFGVTGRARTRPRRPSRTTCGSRWASGSGPAGGRPGPQRGLQRLVTRSTSATVASSRPPRSAALAASPTGPAGVAELAQALGQVGPVPPGLELGEGGLERDAQLQRRLAQPPGVEIGARAQDELLAGQRGVAAAEQRREALLRAQRALASRALGGLLRRRLDGVGPLPVGDLLADAVADAGHERLLAGDLADAGAGRRDAVQGDDPVEDRELERDLVDRVVQPGLRARLVDRVAPDDGRPPRRDGRRLGGGGALAPRRAAAPAGAVSGVMTRTRSWVSSALSRRT
jgi:hypothetical protein